MQRVPEPEDRGAKTSHFKTVTISGLQQISVILHQFGQKAELRGLLFRVQLCCHQKHYKNYTGSK